MYVMVKKDLSNHHTFNIYNFQNNQTDNYILMKTYRLPFKVESTWGYTGAAFSKSGDKSETYMKNKNCYKCNKMEHYARDITSNQKR